MIPDEIKHADVTRVRWLCHASDEAACQACADARVSDTPEIHCARFALHIVRSVPLPSRYVWDVLNAPEYAKGRSAYRAPFEGHVRMMAFAAADLDPSVDPVEFLTRENFGLQQLAIRRFALAPEVVTDERLMELSSHEKHDVRASVARMLRWRATPIRKQLLLRLMEDPEGRVRSAAQNTAGHTQDPELLDLLVAKDDACALNYCNDPRGRPRVEALIYSDDPLYHEWGIALAAHLGDRELLAHLWDHPDWDTRSNAILAAAWRELLHPLDLEEIFSRESAERKAELMMKWPANEAGLLRCARAIKASVNEFPDVDALRDGRSSVLEAARNWAMTNPVFTGAIARLVPNDVAVLLARELLRSSQAEARTRGIQVVVRRAIGGCFPIVAELCLDSDKTVLHEASHAVFRGRMACGLYGLDTAILAAGNDFSAGCRSATALGMVLRMLLPGLDQKGGT